MTVIYASQKPLLGKLRIQSILTTETGLHIGGGGENLSIGDVDKPVIRDPVTNHPYLPGSSLKGKLRAILERVLERPLNRSGGGVYRYESDDLDDGYTNVGNDRQPQYIRFQGAKNCPLSRVFGSVGVTCYIPVTTAEAQSLDFAPDENREIDGVSHAKIRGRNAPARLIVRDSHLIPASADKLAAIDTGLYMTEWKFENSIDRITAAANPRQFERVPRGAQFMFEMVYTIEDKTQVVEDLRNLAIALAILEDDALGGHGSRGYGKVKFSNFQFFHRDVSQYLNSSNIDASSEPFQQFDGTETLLSSFSELQTQVQRQLNSGDESTP